MIKFIDASCQLGRPAVCNADMPWKTEQLLELMDKCNIERAFAYHAAAKEGDVPTGNRLLTEEIRDNPRLSPQWCVLPEFLDAADDLYTRMKTENIQMLRIAPKTYSHDIRPYAMGALMDLAAQCRVPVFMDYQEAPGDALYDLCITYPGVNFVITNTGYELNRFLGPILDNCPNLYVASGNYVVHTGLQLMCKYYSAGRLIFNTNFPTTSSYAAVSLVHFANISREEKELIAHGNIERLLADVTF